MNTKYFTATIVWIIGTAVLFAQSPQVKTDLPQIAPPAPTVAGFMKFEEVPVDNYTGIPDVSIPLYSIQSHSSDIGVNLSLKYHPASIAVSEKSSYVGLGWSLFGGGTISRTVRGLPDDVYKVGGSDSETRIGIHQYSTGAANPYYAVTDFLSYTGTLSATQIKMMNDLSWSTYEKGKYDTEHDLYQFNFMGHSGRFIITYKLNQYEVVKLDNDNAIQISYNGTTKTFTIYDDKGYRFEFDVKEETTQGTLSQYIYFDIALLPATSASVDYPFISAFHLSKVYDANNNLLIEYIFNDDAIDPMNEADKDVVLMQSQFVGQDPNTVVGIMNNHCGQVDKIEAKETRTSNARVTKTKKIKRINITDKARIDFTLINDRQDTGMVGSYRLKEVIIKDWAGNAFKKFTLEQGYSELNGATRMKLTKVSESNPAATTSISYEMFYAPKLNSLNYEKDYWGYYTKRPNNYTGSGLYRETNPLACKADVLQKMRLPSGGAVVFNFESNTYSHIGDQPLTNFDDNPDNWTYSSDNTGNMIWTGTIPGFYTILPSATVRYASFLPYIVSGQAGTFDLYEVSSASSTAPIGDIFSFSCGMDGNNCFYTPDYTLYPNKTYKIRYKTLNTGSSTGGVNIKYKTPAAQQLKYLYGGGLRIKNIGYFDDSAVSQAYYDSPLNQEGLVPTKQKNFNYDFFDIRSKSSGSLVFAKPVFEYTLTKHYHQQCLTFSGMPFEITYDFTFKTTTSFNNLKVQKTHGADVGYKNVTVWETGNGYSRYVYDSPIDVPENNYTITYPFLPSDNYDYKRGLLRNEKHYKEGTQLLTETIYDYDVIESSVMTGMSISSTNNCRFSYRYNNHEFYYNQLLSCGSNSGQWLCNYLCSYPVSYLDTFVVRDYFGWAKLTSKITKEYLGSQTVETKELYTYNSFNKKIESQVTETYGSNETIKNNYYYNNWGNNNISGIERIETRKNNNLLSTQKMLYSNTFPGNASVLPITVQAAKGTQSLENKVQFVKYDEFGNILEAKLENGTSVVYIWGYNKSLPIAMIENATYAGITPSLITNAQTASNGTDETVLTAALTALRNGLPNAMVTTYTHKPLFGVSSITDPKGYKTSFTYDTLGRLQYVKDADGMLLSENEYRYKMP